MTARRFYYPPRAALVEELLAGINSSRSERLNFGVLLSGPNGVGKSGIGLTAFECCLALGNLVVYIPHSSAWVSAAMKGHGDEYFLEQFFLQNAHKIAANQQLRTVFRERLRGLPVSAGMMNELRAAMSALGSSQSIVTVIVDDYQVITNIIAMYNDSSASSTQRAAASYFHIEWSSWNGINKRFVRMDIASSHGTRELKMPSGDEHRLRFVGPWPLDIALSVLSHPKSPLHVHQSAAHSRILHVAGGVMRRLMQCQVFLSSTKRSASLTTFQKALAAMEHAVRNHMKDDCQNWFQKQLNQKQRIQVALQLEPLIRGQVPWEQVKGAYDYGLVARDEATLRAVPVSAIAVSVLHQELSTELCNLPMPPHFSAMSSSERGFELERRVRYRFDSWNGSIKTVRLSGEAGPALAVCVNHVMFFRELGETVFPSALSVYYSPISETHPFDAMIVPGDPAQGIVGSATVSESTQEFSESDMSASSPRLALRQPAHLDRELAPLQVWEMSVTHPRESNRVGKILKWFHSESGCISKLKKLHPNRRIVIVLCWPEVLQGSTRANAYHRLEAEAAEAGVSLLVVDNTALEEMGIALSKPVSQYGVSITPRSL